MDMFQRMMRKGVMLSLYCALGAAAGCEPWFKNDEITPPQSRSSSGDTRSRVASWPTDPNVLEVHPLWDPYASFITSDAGSRVLGLRIKTLYLLGTDQKGVFGEGVLKSRMYLLQRDATMSLLEPRLIQEWEYDVQQLMPYRVTKAELLGWAYAYVPLTWPAQFDLSGREVRVVVTFERPDGRVVSARPKDFKIPRSM